MGKPYLNPPPRPGEREDMVRTQSAQHILLLLSLLALALFRFLDVLPTLGAH
jgi:hypothetical protein